MLIKTSHSYREVKRGLADIVLKQLGEKHFPQDMLSQYQNRFAWDLCFSNTLGFFVRSSLAAGISLEEINTLIKETFENERKKRPELFENLPEKGSAQ